MAERRMFAKTIIDSDAFLDMPVTARLLYYDLAMRADDDGFVNSPKKIMRIIGASQDDLALLIMRKFILPFDNGVVVIKHWRIHNYIRKDTYTSTTYDDLKAQLVCGEDKVYRFKSEVKATERIQSVDEPSTQVSIGKDSIGKDSILGPEAPQTKRFVKPTVEEIRAYCQERHNSIDPEKFFNHYESKGWVVGKSPMKDWKAAVRTWEKMEQERKKNKVDPQHQNPWANDEEYRDLPF